MDRAESELNISATFGIMDPRTSQQDDSESDEEVQDFVDPDVALKLFDKGRATGNRPALWMRSVIQRAFFRLGQFINRFAGCILICCIVILCLGCIALRNVTVESRIHHLWIEEGDRVELEQSYVQRIHGHNSGSTPQIFLQTPDQHNPSLLTAEALLLHLRALQAATEVEVEAFGSTWTLKDICHKVSLPNFDERMPVLSEALDHLYPCTIISPLDCFWEGAKLLGPSSPLVVPGYPGRVSWTNLNPKLLIASIRQATDFGNLDPEPLARMFAKAGITTGYLEKPCLNPNDPACPETAPNKQTKQTPNVADVLSDGCSGVSTKFMRWHEEMLMGDIRRNRSQSIISISALQTTIMVSGSKTLFELYKDQNRVDDWSEEAAEAVLSKFRNKMSNAVNRAVRNKADKDSFTVYSDDNLSGVLNSYSEISFPRVGLGLLILMVYVFFALRRWSDPVGSYSGLGVAGALLASLTVVAGMSLSSMIGIKFNALSTQIVPFLAMAIDVHLIIQMVKAMSNLDADVTEEQDFCAVVLQRTGFATLLNAVCLSASFFAGYSIPVPALRTFCLQMGIIMVLSAFFMIVMFPTLIAIDQRRRSSKRFDILCCFGLRRTQKVNVLYSHSDKISLRSPSGHRGNRRYCSVNCSLIKGRKIIAGRPCACQKLMLTGQRGPYPQIGPLEMRMLESGMVPHHFRNDLAASVTSIPRLEPPECCDGIQSICQSINLSSTAASLYLRFITTGCAKFLITTLFVMMIGASAWGICKVEDGLDMTEFVPKGTPQHRYHEVASKSFGLYNLFAITKGLDYPNSQDLLYEFHQAFARVDGIVKDDDGRIPKFWLAAFRDWLIDLDEAFERDFKANCFHDDGWYPNATDDGVLGFKLRAQTGKPDLPVDPSQVNWTRLVDSKGIINPKGFYHYLSAWASNDVLVYSTLQAMLHPDPKHYLHDPHIPDLKVPKSMPLEFAQFHFMVHQINSTSEILKVIEQVRTICEKYSPLGVPSFPSGILFTYWEQYINLRFYLIVALLILMVGYFMVISFVLMNPWNASIMVIMEVVLLVQMAGLFGWLQIKLNAILAVVLIFASGICVCYSYQICSSFVAALGSRKQRIRRVFGMNIGSVFSCTFASLVGVAILAVSNFEFIFRYFFVVFAGMILLSGLNTVVFLPVILSFMGSMADFVSLIEDEEVPSLTPEPPLRPKYSDGKKRKTPRMAMSTASLSTISEEDSISCQQIYLEPQVYLETTTSFPSSRASFVSSDEKTAADGQSQSMKTKISAHAKIKVELHRLSVPLSETNDETAPDRC